MKLTLKILAFAACYLLNFSIWTLADATFGWETDFIEGYVVCLLGVMFWPGWFGLKREDTDT